MYVVTARLVGTDVVYLSDNEGYFGWTWRLGEAKRFSEPDKALIDSIQDYLKAHPGWSYQFEESPC